MDASVHTYRHIYMDIDALNIHTTEKKKFKITNLDKTIINVNKCIINTFQESLELKFSINCIKNIFKISKLTNNMNIAISNNYPLKFEFNLNRFDYIKYYIAPKISDF